MKTKAKIEEVAPIEFSFDGPPNCRYKLYDFSSKKEFVSFMKKNIGKNKNLNGKNFMYMLKGYVHVRLIKKINTLIFAESRKSFDFVIIKIKT